MANNSLTLASIIEDIFDEYKRDRPDIRAKLPKRLETLLGRIASKYPFWFLVVEPGGTVPGLFPFTIPPTYVYYAEGIWLDVGWFTSLQGQRDYPVSTPANISDLTTTWSRFRAQTIDTIYEFPLAGGRPREIMVREANEFLRCADWTQNQGRPDFCTLFTAGNASFIRFNVTPDTNQYLYAVRIVRQDFPPFSDPSVTNPIFRYAPDLVRTLGLKEVAMMFRDWEAAKVYDTILEGEVDPATGRRSPGLYEALKQETRKRGQAQDEVLEHYAEPPFGQRNNQYSTSQYTEGVYWNGGW